MDIEEPAVWAKLTGVPDGRAPARYVPLRSQNTDESHREMGIFTKSFPRFSGEEARSCHARRVATSPRSKPRVFPSHGGWWMDCSFHTTIGLRYVSAVVGVPSQVLLGRFCLA